MSVLKKIPDFSQRSLAAMRTAARTRNRLELIIFGLGTVTLLMACITVAIAAVYLLQPKFAAFLRTPTPTMPCIEPRLAVGAFTLRIQTEPLAADGALPAAPKDPAVALWVEGTTPDYLMLLNPSAENQTVLASLQPGTSISANWADCTQDAYVVLTVAELPAFSLTQVDQTRGGITLFLPLDASGRGLVVTSGALPSPTETPEPGAPAEAQPTGLQADISFLETSPSEDGKTLRMVLEIKNSGAAALTLVLSDFSLAPDGSPDQPPLSTEPALPLEIAPGEARQLTLVFPHPGGNAAVFRLQDFTAEIYY